jgi:DNA replication and repair protein RecF
MDLGRRRKFIDMMISSLKPNYIHLLNDYNRVLEQRNIYLKQIIKENKSQELLEILDEQLAELSYKIFEYRNYYFEKFANIIQENHDIITKDNKNKEIIKIKYISNAQDKKGFLNNLEKSRTIDLSRGYTSTGIHRDDFMIYINKKIVSIYGSQGQQRTTTLTLKLCELKIVTEEIGETPILLLDDFMSELDEKRRKSFLKNLNNNQVIITCTDNIEIKKDKIKSFYVENGTVQEERK